MNRMLVWRLVEAAQRAAEACAEEEQEVDSRWSSSWNGVPCARVACEFVRRRSHVGHRICFLSDISFLNLSLNEFAATFHGMRLSLTGGMGNIRPLGAEGTPRPQRAAARTLQRGVRA